MSGECVDRIGVDRICSVTGSHSSQPLPSPAAAAATATRREVTDGELRDEIAAALRDEDDWPSGWTGVRVRPVRHAEAGAGLAALLGGLV